MTKKEFIVTKAAMRPASKRERCFYCQQSIGQEHEPDCVLIKKTIKIRAVIEYEVDVPHFWDKQAVEFHRNESSWCCSNILDELKEIDKDGQCLCGIVEFECLGADGEPILKEK